MKARLGGEKSERSNRGEETKQKQQLNMHGEGIKRSKNTGTRSSPEGQEKKKKKRRKK